MLNAYLQHGGPLPAITLEDKIRLLTPRVKQEAYYQTLLSNILKSDHKYIPKAGFTDLSLENAHIEIKIAHRYHEASAQLLKYSIMSPKPYLVVILFGKIKDADSLRRFFRETKVTHVLYFDADDHLHSLYRSTGETSPYFRRDKYHPQYIPGT